MTNYRAITISHLPATDTKCTRTKLKDERFLETITLSRDYYYSNGIEQAKAHLLEQCINIVGQAEYSNFKTIVFTDDFETSIKGGKL